MGVVFVALFSGLFLCSRHAAKVAPSLISLTLALFTHAMLELPLMLLPFELAGAGPENLR